MPLPPLPLPLPFYNSNTSSYSILQIGSGQSLPHPYILHVQQKPHARDNVEYSDKLEYT